MVFSSAVFLWLFLPLVFVVNYFIQEKYSNLFLLAASLIFYAWGEPYMVFFMMVSIMANWLAGRCMARYARYKNVILLFGIVFNIAALVYYKYAGFLVRILNGCMGREVLPVPDISLPIGISFFSFQAISYIVDLYRNEAQAQEKLVNTALYIAFFPQLIAGPIVKYKDIKEQIECRRITKDGIAYGFRRFIYGLSKKVLVSNILGESADYVFSMDVLTIGGKTAWIASVFYTLQIYYDFSGYSDMAIGLGQMFGFVIPENFHYPYLSSSIGEFWRRWHISLGSWFREYLYIPLGGNREGEGKTCFNLLVVFFLTGLWHGASFNFIVWGLYHGFFAILERRGFQKILDKSKVASHVYFLLAVNFGWIFFRMDSLRGAMFFIKRLLMPWMYQKYDLPVWEYMNARTVLVFGCALLGTGVIQKLFPEKVKGWWKYSIPECLYCTGILLLSLAAVVSETYHPFIYFQF